MGVKKPNILIINCDQMQSCALGCYGHPLVKTPNIDRLAQSGVRFVNGISNSPVCMPARSVLMSGQYERTCTGGASNVALPGTIGESYLMPQYPRRGRQHLKDETLPEILKKNGYRTCVLGKWHIWAWPHEIGFDDYVIPRTHHIHSYQHFTDNGGPEFTPEQKWSLDFEADEAIKRFEKWSASEQPFFLYYNFSPPHMPLCDAPEQYLNMYDPAEVPLRLNVDEENYFPDIDFMTKVYRWDYRYYELRLPYTEEVPDGYGIRGVTAHYLGLISWVDDTLGRLMDSLETNGLKDDTIIVFTADHGDNLGSHGMDGKGLPYEESINIPMLYSWAKELPSKVDPDSVASIVDIPATLLGLIGVDVPEHMQGRNLSGLLRNAAVGKDEQEAAEKARRKRLPWMDAGMTICEIGRGRHILVRSETMTAVFDCRDAVAKVLKAFDNKADPYQETDVSDDPAYADTVEGMRQMALKYDATIAMMDEPDYDYRVNLGCVSKEKIDAYLERRARRLQR